MMGCGQLQQYMVHRECVQFVIYSENLIAIHLIVSLGVKKSCLFAKRLKYKQFSEKSTYLAS